MKARFLSFAGAKSRARRASTVGLFLTLFDSAADAQGNSQGEQRRACTPDVRAITACLGACRPVFDQAGG